MVMRPYDDVFLMKTKVDVSHFRNVWLLIDCHVLVPESHCVVDVGMRWCEEGKIVDDCGGMISTMMIRWGNGHIQALCLAFDRLCTINNKEAMQVDLAWY